MIEDTKRRYAGRPLVHVNYKLTPLSISTFHPIRMRR